MKKILGSVITLGVVAAVVVMATNAFFSDTETSTGNVLEAGSIDLLIGSTYASDHNGSGNFEIVTDNNGRSLYNFNDLKPGDMGRAVFNLQVTSNDAYLCAVSTIDSTPENGLTDPEQEAGDTTTGPNGGELQNYVQFALFHDENDNGQWDPGEPVNYNQFGGGDENGFTAQEVHDTGWIGAADNSAPNTWLASLDHIEPGNTYNAGFMYCFGNFVADVSPVPGSLTCDGAGGDYNDAQTDIISGSIEFQAIQMRNNEGFLCSDLNEEGEEELVGAALGDYVQPEPCDVTVDDGGGAEHTTIQAGVNAAGDGETVCVADGTYNENVTITTDNITLAGDGASATSTIDGRIRVNAVGVTIQGFNILGATVGTEGVNGIYIVGGSNNLTISDNRIDGDTHGAGQRIGVHFAAGGTTGAVVTNNVIENWDSTGLYLNPTAGPVSITYNDFLTNNVGIGSSSINNVTITNNDFVGNIAEAMGMDDSAGATGGVEIHINNFTPAGAGNNVNGYGGGVVADATNNWWGGEPLDTDRTNVPAQIDVTSPAGAAFAQN